MIYNGHMSETRWAVGLGASYRGLKRRGVGVVGLVSTVIYCGRLWVSMCKGHKRAA